MKNKIKDFIQLLHEKRIIKKLDITFQVAWNLFLVFIVFGLMLFFFVGGVGAGFFASLVKDEPLRSYDNMKKDIYNYEEISEIYFANNVYLGEIPTELERREISIEDVSKHFINALIATEDEYFYEHIGVVPKAIMRATYQEFANSSIQTGGSTLTQQLVKNQILTNEVSFERKAREIVLAMRLEQYFNKNEILEAYVNIVPFGRNASGGQVAGVQAAAMGIFGVNAKDLSIPQAAFIAGLPQSPFGYTPFDVNGNVRENLEPGINRMKSVLLRMKEVGYITEAEYNEAITYDIKANLTEREPSSIEEYPFVTNEVLRRSVDIIAKVLMENDNINIDELEGEERVQTLGRYRELANRDIRRNGYKIHTTIDKDVHDSMNEAIKDERYIGPAIGGENEEVGALLLENKTGAIIGFVGGRDFTEQNLNHATQAYRSNGSTMKPLLAYGPAIEVGVLSPGQILPDTPHTYSGGASFDNFDKRFEGMMTARVALQKSRNIPAVRAIQKVPHDILRDTMIKLDFAVEDGEPYESSALGRTINDVTVEQNTNAYAAFANEGKFIKSYMIEKIETKDGEIIFEHESEPVEVFSPQTAYIMIDMLRDVLRGGGTASSLPSRLKFSADWSGKTGTSDNFHDSNFVATNPNVTLGIWVGYDTPKPVGSANGLSYSQRTQQMWANLANAAYDVRPDLMAPTERFQMPSGVVQRSICSISGLIPSDLCREAGLITTDLFNVQHVPSTVDDSLERVKYVLLNEKAYIALETTPEEFTHNGIMIKEDYLKNVDLEKYRPESWNNIILGRTAEDNGKTPNAVTNVTIKNDTLSWAKHAETDILGYRVYRSALNQDNYELTITIPGINATDYKINMDNPFTYYITAVDVAGRESAPSNIVKTDHWFMPPVDDPDDRDKDKNKDKDKDKNKPPENRPPRDDDDIEDILDL